MLILCHSVQSVQMSNQPETVHDSSNWSCVEEGHWCTEDRSHSMAMKRFSSSNTGDGEAEGHHKVTNSLTNTKCSVDTHLNLRVSNFNTMLNTVVATNHLQNSRFWDQLVLHCWGLVERHMPTNMRAIGLFLQSNVSLVCAETCHI